MTEKEKESLNKFLTDKFFKECWHEKTFKLLDERYSYGAWVCRFCGLPYLDWEPRQNYFNPDGFIKIWNKAKGSEEWEEFRDAHGGYKPPIGSVIAENLIDPPVFAEAWAKHLGWKGEE